MANPTVCSVTGTCRDSSGSALSGVTITACAVRPYIHPTDSSLITADSVSTTSASDGTWSLSLVETTTPAVSITMSFIYPTSVNSGNTSRQSYTVTIPNTASTTFASLIGSQV